MICASQQVQHVQLAIYDPGSVALEPGTQRDLLTFTDFLYRIKNTVCIGGIGRVLKSYT